MGPIGVDIAYGTTRDSTRGAFRAGLHVPLVIAYLASQLDLYAEAPPQWLAEWDAGLGASLSLYHVMPYVQLGRRTPDGSGWYTTQGVNVVQSGEGSMAVLWMPGVAYAWRRERSTWRLFVTAGAGANYEFCDRACAPEWRHLLVLGGSLEWHRRQ